MRYQVTNEFKAFLDGAEIEHIVLNQNADDTMDIDIDPTLLPSEEDMINFEFEPDDCISLYGID